MPSESSKNQTRDDGILRSKTYLYMTEFFSGMAVMAVELGASRLLAPYFSSSQIVWTIIISTIMIAMALGNLYGGRSADKNPDPDRLYRRLCIAAVWIAAIPVLGKYIILLISGILVITISHNLLIIAGFAACMIIFVFPCFLLGTVTPSLARYTVDSVGDSGRIIGTLGAFNTIGSIIGTFLPTFVTIPAVGTAVTFLIFSGVILILALIYFISMKRSSVLCIVCTALYIICAIFGHSGSFAFWQKNLTYEGESIYNYLQVEEDDRRVILSTNVLFGVQSILIKDDSLTGMYYDYAMAAPVMAMANNEEEYCLDILILGMGTGTYARQCTRYLGAVNIEGVEIDERITSLAYEYFELPETTPVTTYDGRAYLAALEALREDDRISEEHGDGGKYDVIMVDAYQDITIPFQMSSVEFFSMVRDALKPGGVMVVNMNMRSGTEGGINEYLEDTIASVFPYVYTADVKRNTNCELFASDTELSYDAFADKAELFRMEAPEFCEFLHSILTELEEYHGGDHILTDDKAPVELLGIEAIDEIISDEIGYYKEAFRKEGISGLLK